MINKIDFKSDLAEGSKLSKAYNQLQLLLSELEQRDLPQEVIDQINHNITELKAGEFTKKSLNKTETEILTVLETQLDLVPKDHYRRKWLALGMMIFGVPIGVVFGSLIGNIGMLGVGIPIGLAIGIGIGTQKDKKALEEGRQLGF
jgi:hypothetical protein